MFYTDWMYWTFVASCCLLFFLVPLALRPWIIAAAGVCFYMYFAGSYIVLLLIEASVVCCLASLLGRNKPAWLAAGGVAAVAAVLGYFKYSGMLVQTWIDLTSAGPFPRAKQFVIPLGISYFSFELIHYLAESRRANVPPHKPQHFFAFIFFFPTLVAGPIKSFQGFYPQLRSSFELRNVFIGAARIVVGLFKKLVLAGALDVFAQLLYSQHGIETNTALLLWIALVAYTFVIYFDFSGYSDIAIGTARLFGIALPENFRNPYVSRNIAEFWNRWHMTLGAWLTKYVYFPLGGSRVSKVRTYLNLMAVMAVSGLWHGAAWHFVIWGMLHGAMLCVQRFYAKQIKPLLFGQAGWSSPMYSVCAMAVTFFCVTVTRVFFVLPVTEAWNVMLKLFSF